MRRSLIPGIVLGALLCAVVYFCVAGFSSDEAASEYSSEWSVCPGRIKWENVIAAFTLVIMAGCSLESIGERWIALAIARRQSRSFQPRIAEALYFNRIEEAVEISAMYPKSPVAYVVHTALSASSTGHPSMQERQRAVVIKTVDIKRRLWMLAAIGWTAPLVGLFLASVNVMQATLAMKYTEGTGIDILAYGVTDAMWGLSFSLVIAAPTIWMHKYFTSQVETFILEMDKLSLAILGQFTDRQQKLICTVPVARYATEPLDGNPTPQTSR